MPPRATSKTAKSTRGFCSTMRAERGPEASARISSRSSMTTPSVDVMDALGSAIADLIGSGTIDQLQVEASQRGHYHAEIPVRRSGRSERVFEVAAGPLRDDEG